LKIAGAAGGKSLAFNTHLDVVPETEGRPMPSPPWSGNGRVYGRGSNDAKGQVVTVWLVLKALRDLRWRPAGDLTVDFVVRGGKRRQRQSGSSSGNGLQADACIVVEPTELQVAHLVRGAGLVRSEDDRRGRSQRQPPGRTVSALKEAVKCMDSIEKVRKAAGCCPPARPMVAAHPNPMPCTFGMLHTGNWPAAAPPMPSSRGVFGFLPPFHRADTRPNSGRPSLPTGPKSCSIC